MNPYVVPLLSISQHMTHPPSPWPAKQDPPHDTPSLASPSLSYAKEEVWKGSPRTSSRVASNSLSLPAGPRRAHPRQEVRTAGRPSGACARGACIQSLARGRRGVGICILPHTRLPHWRRCSVGGEAMADDERGDRGGRVISNATSVMTFVCQGALWLGTPVDRGILSGAGRVLGFSRSAVSRHA
ncbi:hypothetical protein K402DRAFT_21196 [Aulographum hederae CBS 113979]|uniref:Uncharacterized protein n=1 Tax=Aulographum hederae CBS 113979 TaxID=1176131 RepID=A0A6G1H770_9PEZI|nr:hypothetical protein K402DRAFT_21196 [Aulographum hederae CBS 113979]